MLSWYGPPDPMSTPQIAHARIAKWRRWSRERWRPLVVAALGLPLVVLALATSLHWPSQVFPGFFILDNRLVPTVGLYHWTGMQRGLDFHSRLLSADGHSIETPAFVYEYAAGRRAGTDIVYEVEKHGQRASVTVPTMDFGWRDYWLSLAPFVLNGTLVLLIGILVNLLQPRTVEARAFLFFSAASALIMLTAPPIYHPFWTWLVPLNLFAYAIWGVSFVHLGLVFPVTRSTVSTPKLLFFLYGGAVLLGVWAWSGFYADPPDLMPTYLAMLCAAAGMMAMAALALDAFRHHRDPVTRARLRLILPAFVLATLVAFLGLLDNAREGGSFPINLSAFGPAVFYLAVAYSIVRHDLFAIDRFVKQAAIYAALTAVIASMYGIAVVALGSPRSGDVRTSSWLPNILFFLAVAILFEPARRRLQSWVDRVFFREQVDYRHAVREVSGILATVLDLEQILSRVARTLDAGLAPSSFAVVLWLDSGARLWRRGPSGRFFETLAGATHSLHGHLSRTERRTWVLARHREEQDGELMAARSEAATLDAVMLVPLVLMGRVLGAFALGGKRSGLPYNAEEIELLETLATQSAIAIQNSILFGEVRALADELEEKVRLRTSDLRHSNAELEHSNAELARAYRDLQETQAKLLHSEKLASLGQLVAGVAHEINTPVTAIVGNVRPLSRELANLRERATLHGDASIHRIAERMQAILDVVGRGAERTAGIVQDLRTFSRIDETQPQPCDLREGIEASLRLLRPQWVGRIQVHTEYGELPLVSAAAGPINQVFMNLIANACDAVEGSGNVWIRTSCDGDSVAISIQDDGCGVAPENLSRIFDPFFTTKKLGQGTGLGLAISAGIIRDHGGTVEVESTPRVGSTFRVVLPVRRPKAESPSQDRDDEGRLERPPSNGSPPSAQPIAARTPKEMDL